MGTRRLFLLRLCLQSLFVLIVGGLQVALKVLNRIIQDLDSFSDEYTNTVIQIYYLSGESSSYFTNDA
jgi:hypothetical protein